MRKKNKMMISALLILSLMMAALPLRKMDVSADSGSLLYADDFSDAGLTAERWSGEPSILTDGNNVNHDDTQTENVNHYIRKSVTDAENITFSEAFFSEGTRPASMRIVCKSATWSKLNLLYDADLNKGVSIRFENYGLYGGTGTGDVVSERLAYGSYPQGKILSTDWMYLDVVFDYTDLEEKGEIRATFSGRVSKANASSNTFKEYIDIPKKTMTYDGLQGMDDFRIGPVESTDNKSATYARFDIAYVGVNVLLSPSKSFVYEHNEILTKQDVTLDDLPLYLEAKQDYDLLEDEDKAEVIAELGNVDRIEQLDQLFDDLTPMFAIDDFTESYFTSKWWSDNPVIRTDGSDVNKDHTRSENVTNYIRKSVPDGTSGITLNQKYFPEGTRPTSMRIVCKSATWSKLNLLYDADLNKGVSIRFENYGLYGGTGTGEVASERLAYGSYTQGKILSTDWMYLDVVFDYTDLEEKGEIRATFSGRVSKANASSNTFKEYIDIPKKTMTYDGLKGMDDFRIGPVESTDNKSATYARFDIAYLKIRTGIAPEMLATELTAGENSEGKSTALVTVGADLQGVLDACNSEGETFEKFGIVFVPGTVEAEALREKAQDMLRQGTMEDAATGHKITEVTEIPENWSNRYYVTIDNSGESNTLGKRYTAVAYVVTSKDGATQYYFSGNSDSGVSDGVTNKSVMGLMKEYFVDVCLPEYDALDATGKAESDLQKALETYNSANNANYTVDDIRAIAELTGVTTNTQRELLKHIYLYICSETDM